MACPACGGEAPEGARFCPGCGSSLDVSSDSLKMDVERIRLSRIDEMEGKIRTHMSGLIAAVAGAFIFFLMGVAVGGVFVVLVAMSLVVMVIVEGAILSKYVSARDQLQTEQERRARRGLDETGAMEGRSPP